MVVVNQHYQTKHTVMFFFPLSLIFGCFWGVKFSKNCGFDVFYVRKSLDYYVTLYLSVPHSLHFYTFLWFYIIYLKSARGDARQWQKVDRLSTPTSDLTRLRSAYSYTTGLVMNCNHYILSLRCCSRYFSPSEPIYIWTNFNLFSFVRLKH